jgi:5,10-methylenetetrahydromethanopterin reductase
MKLALGFNPVLTARAAGQTAAKAESMGYDSMWMHESLFQRDVVTYLATALGVTTTLRAGSGVLNTFTRHPVTVAVTFASLSELSAGRAILGLGLGSFPTIPLIGGEIFPVEKTKPLRRIKEFIRLVKMVWSGEKVEFDGEFFHVHGLTMGFESAKAIPLFVASLSPRTLEFAGATADGVILSPALNTVAGTEAMIRAVSRGEQRSGRRVERASYMLTSVGKTGADAVRAVKDYYFFAYQLAEVVRPEVLEPYGVDEEKLRPFKDAWKKGQGMAAKGLIPDEAVESLTLCGTADHAMDRAKEYARAGVTLPILMPIGDVEGGVRAMAPGRA